MIYRDSSVSIETRQGAGRPRFDYLHAGAEVFHAPHRVQAAFGATPAFYKMDTGERSFPRG
jgi:hypothetical protein